MRSIGPFHRRSHACPILTNVFDVSVVGLERALA